MEIPILEQGASKLWTAEHRAWNSVRNFPLESTTPSTRNWPTRLLFYFCAKAGFFFIPKILLFLTRVHFNWWLIGPFLTASWPNVVLRIAFSSWNWLTRLPVCYCAKPGVFFIPKILLFLKECTLLDDWLVLFLLQPGRAVFFLYSKNSAFSNKSAL